MNNCKSLKVSAFFKGKPYRVNNHVQIDEEHYDLSKDVMAFSTPNTPFQAANEGLSYVVGLNDNMRQNMVEQHIEVTALKELKDYLNVLDTHPKTKSCDAYLIRTRMGHILLEKGEEARKAVDEIIAAIEEKDLPMTADNFMLSAFFSKSADGHIAGKQLKTSYLRFELNNEDLGEHGLNMSLIPRRHLKAKTLLPSKDRYRIDYHEQIIRKNEPLFWTCVPTKVEQKMFSLYELDKVMDSLGMPKKDLANYSNTDIINLLNNRSDRPETSLIFNDPTYCPAPNSYPVIDLKELSIASLNCNKTGGSFNLPFFDDHKEHARRLSKAILRKKYKSKAMENNVELNM